MEDFECSLVNDEWMTKSYRECNQPMNGGSECEIDDVTGKIDEKYLLCDPGRKMISS